ncbi:hypothetical protein [Azospirillum sp. B506]|uniref:hypothetical protein n=1 Tax=Azospirillum sp. B506 TaxID=137721 RepID=UPI00131F067C|nr:hypothetical protein [Azospirillum sp. B506]
MTALVVVSGAGMLSGCAVDPVGLAIGAAGKAGAPSQAAQVAETASFYRGTSCQAPAMLLQMNTDRLSSVPQGYFQSMSVNIQALRQVIMEQRCPASASGTVTGVEPWLRAPLPRQKARGAPGAARCQDRQRCR